MKALLHCQGPIECIGVAVLRGLNEKTSPSSFKCICFRGLNMIIPTNSSSLISTLSLPIKENALVVVDDNTIFNVSFHGCDQHALFQKTSLANQVIDFIAMRNAVNVLFNNGPLVKLSSGVVSRGTNQLGIVNKKGEKMFSARQEYMTEQRLVPSQGLESSTYLDTAFVCTMVGFAADKGRQERVMDIDDRVSCAKFVRDDLHVSC